MKRAGKNRFLTGGVLLLSFCSLISVGFSSWSIGANPDPAFITASADNVERDDYHGAAFYVQGSEKGFDYFIFENSIKITSSEFRITVKVSPTITLNRYQEQKSVPVFFGLTYSTTNSNLKLFEKTTGIEPPETFRCEYKKNSAYYLESDSLVYSRFSNNDIITHYLSGEINLFSQESRSLYSIAKERNSYDGNFVYFDIVFRFSVDDMFANSFKNVSMNFVTSLVGAVS